MYRTNVKSVRMSEYSWTKQICNCKFCIWEWTFHNHHLLCSILWPAIWQLFMVLSFKCFIYYTIEGNVWPVWKKIATILNLSKLMVKFHSQLMTLWRITTHSSQAKFEHAAVTCWPENQLIFLWLLARMPLTKIHIPGLQMKEEYNYKCLLKHWIWCTDTIYFRMMTEIHWTM